MFIVTVPGLPPSAVGPFRNYLEAREWLLDHTADPSSCKVLILAPVPAEHMIEPGL